MIERVLTFFLGVHESVLVDFVSQNLSKLSVASEVLKKYENYIQRQRGSSAASDNVPIQT